MSQLKKALIVSPYLDNLGGGERYMLSAASVLEQLGYQVTFAWDNAAQIVELATMLGIKLNPPRVDPLIKSLYTQNNTLKMYRATKEYDVVVYLSDGSIPLLGGKKNIVHFQVPFHGVGGRKIGHQLKLKSIHHVVVNSQFTKNIVDQEYNIKSTVLYPPVPPIKPGVKTNTILSVGRFDPSLNVKKQNILIDAFRELTPQLPGWQLILAGASSNDEWISVLKQQADNLPIRFATNISYAELSQLYGSSRIYWHAAGFGVDEERNPELTEHFGISTVEAISSGATPLVIPFGGQREIVTDPALHWTSSAELVTKTIWLSGNPTVPSLDITAFSFDNFAYTLQSLI